MGSAQNALLLISLTFCRGAATEQLQVTTGKIRQSVQQGCQETALSASRFRVKHRHK